MRNWKSFLLLFLVFFAGLVMGVVGTRIVVRRMVQQAIAHPQRIQFFVERNLTRRVGLDRDQQAQLHEIMTGARGELGVLRKEFQPQVAQVLFDTDRKISALLTPAQQVRYDRFKERNWPALERLREPPPGQVPDSSTAPPPQSSKDSN